MSSFNIGPSSNQPMVTGSQNLGKDGGGGGNTGYMNMRKRKRGAKQNEEDNSVFLEEEIADTFEKSDKPKKQGRFAGVISSFIKNKSGDNSKIKDSFTKNEEEQEAEENEEDFADYNIRTQKTIDPLEDDEYEIADDDEYYNDVDV